MGTIENRLKNLEARTPPPPPPPDPHEVAMQAVCSSLSVPELRLYIAALKRLLDEEELIAEDHEILGKVEALYQEIRYGR